jgi:hypothetical protein
MKLKINFDFVDSTEILEVELLDNPGVQKWAELCKKLPTIRTTSHQPIISVIPISLSINPDLWIQQQLVQQQLSVINLPIPMPVDFLDQITQQHLNVWHRWFTHHTRGYPPTTEYHWLHELNQIVHKLEQCFREWPNPQLGVRGYEMNFTADVDKHGFAAEFVDLTPYREYHSWESADLILDQAVHGKTTMQSFLDNDDPKNWDTTGHHMSWGGCKLVKSYHRQGIYQDDLFRQWMNQNNVTHGDLFGDFPLGNIVNRDQSVIDRIFESVDKSTAESVQVITNLTILD